MHVNDPDPIKKDMEVFYAGHQLGKFVTVGSVSAPNFVTPIKFNPGGTVRLLNLRDSSALRTGDAVKYDAGGGTSIPELAADTVYFIIDLGGGHYQLAASRDDA